MSENPVIKLIDAINRKQTNPLKSKLFGAHVLIEPKGLGPRRASVSVHISNSDEMALAIRKMGYSPKVHASERNDRVFFNFNSEHDLGHQDIIDSLVIKANMHELGVAFRELNAKKYTELDKKLYRRYFSEE